MGKILVPIVGMHFRPPAKVVLEQLGAGVALRLVAEPENPYDPQAIRVEIIPREAIPEAAWIVLPGALAGHGWELADLMRMERFQLGYVARTNPGAKKPVLVGNAEVWPGLMANGGAMHARLGFDGNGAPMAEVEVG